MQGNIPNPFYSYSSPFVNSTCLYEKDGSRQIRVVELPKIDAFYIVDFKMFIHGEQMSLNIPKVL
jgi:hypothetical protein